MAICPCGRLTKDGSASCHKCLMLRVLGLENGATASDIKEAYRTLVKVWHPDRFPGDETLRKKADVRLAGINYAYQHLQTHSATDGPNPPLRPEPPPPPRPAAQAKQASDQHASSTDSNPHPMATKPIAPVWLVRNRMVCTIFAVLMLLVGSLAVGLLHQSHTPAVIVDGPAYIASVQHSAHPSPDLPVDTIDKVINVDAPSFLAAYQSDESAANTRFRTRKVAVTGVLTGVFVPSMDVSMRVAERGGTADAFVTMGGPSPTSAEETLLLPGITAYSESSSLFGQSSINAVTDQLIVGETVTLVCTCRDALRVSDLVINRTKGKIDYSVTLEDCTLQNDSQLGDPSQGPIQTQSSQETATPNSRFPPVGSSISNGTGGGFVPGTTGDAGGAPRPIGGGVSSPELVYKVDPEFSEEARKDKFNGVVLVNLIVDEHGLPQNVHILRGVGRGLDEKAVEAVRQYKFRPAKEAGKPVAVELNVEVNFQICELPQLCSPS